MLKFITKTELDNLGYPKTLEDWTIEQFVTIRVRCGAKIISIENDGMVGITITLEGKDGEETIVWSE